MFVAKHLSLAGSASKKGEGELSSQECFFKGVKHNERRRGDRKILIQDFESLLAEAALAYNLNYKDYVTIVCGSLEKLPEAFAKIDFERKQRTFDNKPQADFVSIVHLPLTESASLPSADRRLIRTEQMKQLILTVASRYSHS